MLNKIKRNRILPLFIIGIAAISLGSVAFSTWIISWNSSETSFTSTINVDSYKHKTIVCEGNYNVSKINFDSESGGSGITAIDNENKEVTNPILKTAVIIPSSYFDSIDVSGKTEEEKNDTVVGKIELNLNALVGETDNNLISGISSFDRNPNTTYSYLKLTVDNYTLKYSDFVDYDKVAKYKIANISLSLSITYGNYFNDLPPDDFYEDKISEAKLAYTSGGSRDTYLKTLQTITNELDSFEKALNEEGTLNIEIKAIINGINDN